MTGEPLIQRDDDRPEVVKKRLMEYEKMTRPVVEFYRDHGILHEFTGETTNEIWPHVLECLSQYMPVKAAKLRARI